MMSGVSPLVSSLVLVSFTFTLTSSLHVLVPPDHDHSPVLVELYYESLCPGCRAFVTGSLYAAYTLLQDTGIMKIAMYPYGNAHQSQNPDGSWSFECQHGENECLGNLLEVCVMAHTDWDFNHYLPIISCMEGADNPVEAAKGCITDLSSLPYQVVKTCASGPQGNSLMHSLGNKTESLDPPHEYVPWVVVDGEHTEDMEKQAMGDLVGLVCGMYKGSKPPQCSEREPVSNVFIQKDWREKDIVNEHHSEEEVEEPEEDIEVNLVGDNTCVICKYIASTIDKMVSDKTNEKQIEAALEVLCSFLPPSKEKQCDKIVEAYTELIIDMLTKDVSPELLCENLGLCPSGRFDIAEDHHTEPEEVEEPEEDIEVNLVVGDNTCEICKFIASTIDKMVSDKTNEKQIEAALETLCSFLSTPREKQCDKIVEAYTQIIIDMLTKDVSPELLCENLGLCPTVRF